MQNEWQSRMDEWWRVFRKTDERMNIVDCRVIFATENSKKSLELWMKYSNKSWSDSFETHSIVIPRFIQWINLLYFLLPLVLDLQELCKSKQLLLPPLHEPSLYQQKLLVHLKFVKYLFIIWNIDLWFGFGYSLNQIK